MKNLFEKIMDTQELNPDDRLSKILNKYSSDELNEEDLDFVMAAGKSDYQNFLDRMNQKKETGK